MEPATYDDLKAAMRSSRRAFHLELRDTYTVESEDEPFLRFLHGDADDYAWLNPWLDLIGEVSGAGTHVQRARIVTVPHTDYSRWGLEVAHLLVRAGEDVRYLPRHLTDGIEFPPEDYWLFDDDRLILSVFSADGRQGGFATADDPGLVARCGVVRDQVWAKALPHAEYVRQSQ